MVILRIETVISYILWNSFCVTKNASLQAKEREGSLSSIHSAVEGKGDYDIIGEVLLKLQYNEGHLFIYVDRARGLAAADSNGLSDPYVKTYLLPDRSKHSKRKTEVKKKTLNPVFNETLTVGGGVWGGVG